MSHAHSAALQSLAVGLGAALGGMARWRLGLALDGASGAAWPNLGFPWGTMVVNWLGGLAIGMALVWLSRGSLWYSLCVVGVLGGFTTFSAFSAESLGLLQRHQVLTALGHGAAHVLGSLFFTWLGWTLGRAIRGE